HGLSLWLSGGAVLLGLLANWPAELWAGRFRRDPRGRVFAVVPARVLLGFFLGMGAFRLPPPTPPTPASRNGTLAVRHALPVWITVYLGLLPSFLMQLRWLPPSPPKDWGGALALGIFIPKCCDIGAYFTGRFLGRHKMAPVLSPKKTWEGVLGGLLLS